LVHLCQKKVYDLTKIIKHQDTFLDAILARFLEQEGNQKYHKLNFSIQLNSDFEDNLESEDGLSQIIHAVTLNQGEREFETMNIHFVRECN
jgi:beta-xylosidase